MGLGKLTENIFQNTTLRRLTLLGISGLSLIVTNALARNTKNQEQEEQRAIELIIPQETYKVIFPFEEPITKFEKKFLKILGEVDYMNLVRRKTDMQMATALSNIISNSNPLNFPSLFNILIEQRDLTPYIALEDMDKYNLTKSNYQGTIDPTRPLPQPVFYQQGRLGNLIPLKIGDILLPETNIIPTEYPKQITSFGNIQGWVHEKGDTVFVDVRKITDGRGYFNTNNQQYKFLSINTAFGYDGAYKGELFKNIHPSWTDKPLIEITPYLVPNDGILQGLIVEKFEDGKPIAYIFLDEDWKKQFGDNINITWGSIYQNFKPFKFKPVANGVYMNRIEDDITRFSEDFNIHHGGIMVGNIQTPGVNMLQIEGDITVISLH